MNEQRFEFLRNDYVQGFPSFCGITVGRIDKGFFESILTPGSEHLQREGFVHAGLLATMADHTGGYAAYTLVPETHSILTIEFKINFFKPAVGKQIFCRSTILNAGKKILTAESDIYALTPKDTEKRVSRATVTLMSLPGK